MNSILMAAAFIMLCIAGLSLSGCQKNPGIPPCSPVCQISEIKGNLENEGGYLDSLAIVYNNKNNPVSMTRNNVGNTWPNYFFLYDHKGRMTDFYGVYPNPLLENAFDTWHRFYYDSKNRVIIDTTYEFGIVGPGPKPIPRNNRPNLSVRNISTYTYDNQNRIIKTTYTQDRDTVFMIKLFSYNHSGNLVKIEEQFLGTSNIITFGAYDNKINYHRTNSIWQFLDQDYSMNNLLPIAAYNSYNLPTLLLDSEPGDYRVLAGLGFRHAKIEYSCEIIKQGIPPLIK
ncbi:hypothetical protein SAMN05518672_10790 [Chitinophaga sp. CF118]|uniref:hypothetical protein n=1 Tax=Chitinophaga sp. CF118 TaxID=1884367 RepID=UPI0008F3C814|nr:hypothetical protein [Chitinophaga sp. CF118]SFE52428.1 hypothetical protein SAMN05518672_10790 [Chitinophaga sp. CF118]